MPKLSISIAHPMIGSSVLELVVSSERGMGFRRIRITAWAPGTCFSRRRLDNDTTDVALAASSIVSS